MANTRHTYHLHSNEIEEIIKREGLPEEISTEAQLWDQIIKKLAYNCPRFLLPLIDEVYGKKYPVDTPIVALSTEYSVERADTKEISTIKADLTFSVDEHDIYHFECEITYEGLMAIRMFEYDVHAALSFRRDVENSPYLLEFPKSAVLFLQDTDKLPKYLTCTIKFQDESTHEYKVPTIAVQSYSLEEIKEKHLCILIPFLPIRYRSHIPKDKDFETADSAKIKSLTNSLRKSKEELTSFFEETILILEDEARNGFLNDAEKELILDLLQKSMIRVSYRNQDLCQEVYTMTEPILKLRSDKYWELKREKDSIQKAYDQQSRILADKDAELADKDAILEEYKHRYGELKVASNSANSGSK